MRSERENLLSIPEWTNIMGLNPWLMAQYGYRSSGPPLDPMQARPQITGDCNDPFFEYRWSNESFSRYELSRAIEDAELEFSEEFGYWPAPKYFINEEIEYPVNWNPRSISRGGMANIRGEPKSIQVKWKYIQQTGVELITQIGSNIPLILSDTTLDGIDDRFTLSLTVPAGTLASEISIYFTDNDRNSLPLAEWQIRPVSVSIDNTVAPPVATIIGNSYCLAPPDLVLNTRPSPLFTDNVLHFINVVDVYRHTIDMDDQGFLIWNSDCASPSELACYGAVNAKYGILTPQIVIETCTDPLDPDTCTRTILSNNNGYCGVNGGKPPLRVYVNYLAGYPRRSDGRMDRYHAQIISWLAASKLSCEPCGCACDGGQYPLSWYSQVLTNDGGSPYQRNQVEECRFGPANGAIKAWNLARTMSLKGIGSTG